MNILRKAFERINHLIFDPSFKERFRSNSQDFSRRRSLSFEFTIFSILELAKKSLQIHLNVLFLQMGFKPVTKQAFSLSRQKVSWEAFRTLNEAIVYTFYNCPNVKFFKRKYLVLAIDGSTINLPGFKELADFFGKCRNQSSERVVGRISILYDVLNKITLDTRIGSYTSSEKEMAIQHVEWLIEFQKKVNKKIIVVFDRGYPSIGLFLLLKKLGIEFVCRAHSSIHQKALKELQKINEDRQIFLEPVRPYQRKRAQTWLRLLPEDDQNYKCRLRCSKVKHLILLTTLFDKAKFKRKELEKIYSERWGIETNYRSIKVDTLLENFSGKKLVVVFQEIHATMIVQNLARIFESDLCSQKSIVKRNEFQPNHREVLGLIKLAISQAYKKGLTALNKLLTLIKPNWGKIKRGRNYSRSLLSHRPTSRHIRLCYA